MKDLYISTDAFWSLALATIEVFRKECFGFLVGYETSDGWIVQRAVPHQTAKRSHLWVEPQALPRRRIEKALHSLALGEKIVGWFHSHPESSGRPAQATPSEEDVAFSEEHDVILVLAIRSQRKNVGWSQNHDGSISGSIGDYHVILGAFAKKRGGEVDRLRVHCAYAHGFKPLRHSYPKALDEEQMVA